MLEDLFSVVKVRFNGDKADDDKKKTDIPKGLLFKCPRCRNVTFCLLYTSDAADE